MEATGGRQSPRSKGEADGVGPSHRRQPVRAHGSTAVPGPRQDRRSRIRRGLAILGCAAFMLLASSGSAGAQSTPLPSKEDQKKIVDWLAACDLNDDLTSVTCAEIEHCAGKESIRKSEHPLIYEFMRDPDRDGIVCEHWEPLEHPNLRPRAMSCSAWASRQEFEAGTWSLSRRWIPEGTPCRQTCAAGRLGRSLLPPTCSLVLKTTRGCGLV